MDLHTATTDALITYYVIKFKIRHRHFDKFR